MVAVPAYRPRFGTIAAVWFRTIKAAKREDVSTQAFLHEEAPRGSIPSDVVVARIRQVRVCNVVVTTGNYPTVRLRFARLIALLRKEC